MPLITDDDAVLYFSPSLAATIGLEGAILLGVLTEYSHWQNPADADDAVPWQQVPVPVLAARLPFWSLNEVDGVAAGLQEKGLLQWRLSEGRDVCHFAFDDGAGGGGALMPPPVEGDAPPGGLRRMERGWRPGAEALDILVRDGVARDFADSMVEEFVLYWRERGEARPSWNSAFVRWVRRGWQQRRAQSGGNGLRQQVDDDSWSGG